MHDHQHSPQQLTPLSPPRLTLVCSFGLRARACLSQVPGGEIKKRFREKHMKRARLTTHASVVAP